MILKKQEELFRNIKENWYIICTALIPEKAPVIIKEVWLIIWVQVHNLWFAAIQGGNTAQIKVDEIEISMG